MSRLSLRLSLAAVASSSGIAYANIWRAVIRQVDRRPAPVYAPVGPSAPLGFMSVGVAVLDHPGFAGRVTEEHGLDRAVGGGGSEEGVYGCRLSVRLWKV